MDWRRGPEREYSTPSANREHGVAADGSRRILLDRVICADCRRRLRRHEISKPAVPIRLLIPARTASPCETARAFPGPHHRLPTGLNAFIPEPTLRFKAGQASSNLRKNSNARARFKPLQRGAMNQPPDNVINQLFFRISNDGVIHTNPRLPLAGKPARFGCNDNRGANRSF